LEKSCLFFAVVISAFDACDNLGKHGIKPASQLVTKHKLFSSSKAGNQKPSAKCSLSQATAQISGLAGGKKLGFGIWSLQLGIWDFWGGLVFGVWDFHDVWVLVLGASSTVSRYAGTLPLRFAKMQNLDKHGLGTLVTLVTLPNPGRGGENLQICDLALGASLKSFSIASSQIKTLKAKSRVPRVQTPSSRLLTFVLNLLG
jgi:hypothetical protein